MVPAPAGHIALWRNRRRRRRLLLLRFLSAAPRNGEVDTRRQRGSEPLRARGAAGELRGAHYRPTGCGHMAPRAFVAAASCPLGVRLRSLPEFSAAAGGNGRSACRRLRAWRPFAPGSAGGCRPVRGHVPACACRGRRVLPRRQDLADQTLTTNGVRSLSEAAPQGLKGGGGGGLRLPGGFLGFTVDDPERSRLLR